MDRIKCYFKKIHNQLDAGFNKALQKYGLTCTQFDILAYLANSTDGQTTLTDISQHFGVRHTSAIHVLKLLEKKGFISKSTSTDGRSKTILLTNNAQQVLSEIGEQGALLNEIMFKGLSGPDLLLLEKMLGQILRNLESGEFKKFGTRKENQS